MVRDEAGQGEVVNSSGLSDTDDPMRIGDRYAVLRTLGRGASATTLLCKDLERGLLVAVKELRFQHLENWKYLELFEREAKVLAMLSHPGIPAVVDFFQTQGTSTALYLVQEFIDGPSLLDRVDHGPFLAGQEVIDLALGLLDVLEYLHGRVPPVLHRDIKPSNVLVREGGDPVLVDFGGVCYGWRPPDHTGTTVVGTSGYMPMEQFLGQGGPPSDLYSLGATLLHLVTGVPPQAFRFESGRLELPDMLPAQPSLGRLIEALLRPAPRDRPQTATEARDILLAGSMPPARGTGVLVHSGGVRKAFPFTGAGGPRFLEVGPPPRDPKRDLSDVYRNLVDPLNPSRTPLSPRRQAWHRFEYAFVSIGTLGIIPLLYRAKVRSRVRHYRKLFVSGESTRGWIVSVRQGEVFGTCTYEYDVGGTTYRELMDYWTAVSRYWSEGDTVPVLYDSKDPSRSCFVFR